MKISKRLMRAKPSATLAVNAKAQELRAQGKEIVSLAVGEPDFPTPQHVCEAMKKAVDDGFHRYTAVPGLPELRRAVADYYGRFYGVKATADNTIISNGGKQSLYNLFMALIDQGDEVLIPAPYWVSYPAMVELADGVPVIVPTTAESGFLAQIKDLEACCTERTKLLVINTPSNPTGGHYPQAHLDEIANWAKSKGIFIVSDEVYDRLVYAPAEYSTLSTFWEKNPEDVAIVGALSKSFCMTGWRVGTALAHPDLVKAMVKIQGQSTSNVNTMAQKAAIAAFDGSWDFIDEMRDVFHRRRDIAHEIITSWPGVVCPKPDGAFYLFPVLENFYTEETPDSASMCTKILEEVGIALVPGSAFGDDRCIRFSYAVDDEVLKTSLGKIGNMLMNK
ncbi:pyridoxal phosphate-dependent aminotransferase [Maridesulfovibrio zosterae]|uniref:pyridoxal phosphate-dependent aminotransferase n=1 Tax=Maridesulfovibrio zosterae TaxID=82171 RepID=UPI0003F85272|nr:pyridoxal phosphate-dependent aminotransferase [Maridesulfovibrio zosterae]